MPVPKSTKNSCRRPAQVEQVNRNLSQDGFKEFKHVLRLLEQSELPSMVQTALLELMCFLYATLAIIVLLLFSSSGDTLDILSHLVGLSSSPTRPAAFSS